MIGVPINSNSVYIPMVQTGCCRAEFDSTYPVHLNGIISQDEFRESINKINRVFSSLQIYGVICLMLDLVGIVAILSIWIIFITSKADTSHPFATGDRSVGFGIAFIIFGVITIGIGIFVQCLCSRRMRHAIAEESMKYSSKLPTPCIWRLEFPKICFRKSEHHQNSPLVQHIVIDIDHSMRSECKNQIDYSIKVASEPASFFGQEKNSPPPLYFDQSGKLCSQCGVARQDLRAKFCSSCGQSFNIF